MTAPRSPKDDAPRIVGESPAWLAALEHASTIAALERPVLVVGERGVGKELVAARIHFLSQRWDRDYVQVNCAAMSEELLDSELFGHEAGAFTGAQRRHVGRFERADGGTLFLDEIASASLRAQEKILRVIEYGAFERVGGDQTRTVDVRVVAAANVDLPSRAAKGSFRADLLDRLAFDVVTLPPLRARPQDITLLAEHFARAMARELGARTLAGFTPQALEQLRAHAWPGNVRELKNVAERAVYHALARGGDLSQPLDAVTLDPFASPWRPRTQLHRADAAPAASPPPPQEAAPIPFTEQVEALERRLIASALEDHDGHQGRAAAALGLTYHQFRGIRRKHARADASPPRAD